MKPRTSFMRASWSLLPLLLALAAAAAPAFGHELTNPPCTFYWNNGVTLFTFVSPGHMAFVGVEGIEGRDLVATILPGTPAQEYHWSLRPRTFEPGDEYPNGSLATHSPLAWTDADTDADAWCLEFHNPSTVDTSVVMTLFGRDTPI